VLATRDMLIWINAVPQFRRLSESAPEDPSASDTLRISISQPTVVWHVFATIRDQSEARVETHEYIRLSLDLLVCTPIMIVRAALQ